MVSKALWRHGQFAAFCVLAAVLSACSGQGGAAPQSALPPVQMPQQEQQIAEDAQQVAQERGVVPDDPAATTTGPIAYVSDTEGVLWTVNLGNNTIHRVGSMGAILTDLGFDPINHVLYGIDFMGFYRVNTTTARATYIGQLGIFDANALVFDANGRGYTEGYDNARLYAINNVATGRTSIIGSTGIWKSAGDLTFYNNTLVLAGYTGTTLTTTTKEAIVTLNRTTGAVEHVAQTNVVNLFGLVSTSTSHLYGFANTSLYRILPAATTVAGRAVLIKNFAGTGVSQIMGAAYNGDYQL